MYVSQKYRQIRQKRHTFVKEYIKADYGPLLKSQVHIAQILMLSFF